MKSEIELYRMDFKDYNIIDLIDFIGGITKGEFRLKNKNKRSNEQKNKLFKKLKTESAGFASSVFEFIPAIIEYDKEIENLKNHIGEDNFYNNFLRNCYVEGSVFYTNYRNILKIEQLYNYKFNYITLDWKDNIKFNNFKIIYGIIPFKVISHLVRHRRFSYIVETSRSKKYFPDFYIPEEFTVNNLEYEFSESIEKIISIIQYFKELNIKSETVNMFLPQYRMVKFAMCGWNNDPYTFSNLFAVRDLNQGTMNITNKVVKKIQELIS